MKIAFVIPFHYKWGNYSNVKAHCDYLQLLGHKVDLFSRNKKDVVDYHNYDQIWLMGAGAKIDDKTWYKIALETKTKVIAFGWSDPNLFSLDHAHNCHAYFTNDLKKSEQLTYNSDKQYYYYYQTTCDKRYHKNLNLEKTTDILVYGVGNHKFIPYRNQVVNKLRRWGLNIKVFGRSWDKHPDTYGFIEGQQFIEEINKAKIVLDITTKISAWGHRIFESSACGTPVLTYDREDTKKLLKPGSEILLYKSLKDINETLQNFLKYPEQLKQIGANAQARCYKDHDISVRIQELFKILEEIK